MGGLRGIDMFRKIPADLTSATTTGAILSVAAADEINAALANVSHVVNHLSFGAPVPPKLARRVERKYPSFSRGSSLDGRGFINAKAHEAAHHYVKVVSTHFDVGSFLSSLSADASTAIGYQTLVQTQTMAYHELDVPEAKFSYDLSPMAVAVRTTGKRWYDFVTSICAIVGGTFTTVGLVDAVAHKVLKAGKQL